MITTATVRSTGRLDDAAATRIADLWNAAYPGLRDILTEVIAGHRSYLAKQVGQREESQLVETRRYIKNVEEIRRELGQLDRGTHRACTRSAPAFHPGSALNVVRHAMDVMPFADDRAGAVYRLAADLSDTVAAQHAARRAQDSAS